jgi:hypothetical protein
MEGSSPVARERVLGARRKLSVKEGVPTITEMVKNLW